MFRIVAILALGLLLSVPAFAVPVEVAMSDWDESRSTPSTDGVVGNGVWADTNDGFVIDWLISQTGGNYKYEYTFSDKTGSGFDQGDLSHWIIQTSDFITADNWELYIWDIQGPVGEIEFDDDWSGNRGNPGLINPLHGLKLNWDGTNEGSSQTYSFMSTQRPVWGDFYAKDGNPGGTEAYAMNTGLSTGTDPTAGDSPFTSWVPTPDTEPGRVIPEPATVSLLAIGVVGLLLLTRRRRRL